MKSIKHLTAIVLGGSLLFLMCACSNGSDKKDDEKTTRRTETETESTFSTEEPDIGIVGYTIDPDREDDAPDPAVETTIDEYGISQICLPSGELGSLIGFDNCYCTGYKDVIDHCNWTIYSGDGQEIACQFGFGCESAPDCYLTDLDGNGEDELVCNCTYGADGAMRVFIFRNQNGVIEVGSFDESVLDQIFGDELCVLAYNMFYDEAQKAIVIGLYTGEEHVVSMNYFTFSQYIPGEPL